MANDIRIHITSAGGKRSPFYVFVLKSAVFVSILFGPGVLVESPAMQWAGFVVMLTLCVVGMIGVLLLAGAKGMTIEQARKKLDEIEDGKMTAPAEGGGPF